MKTGNAKLFVFLSIVLISFNAHGQNPIIRDQFTADPSARVIGDRVYVFPSHDIRCEEGQGRGPSWFCMEDYHVFSSENLTDWKDHGMILSQNEVAWTNPNSYSMWAPDCIEKDGKYYFYFPTMVGDTTKYWRGFGVGVAVADKPEGPYVARKEPIDKIRGIDPNVFIDKDGQAYIYWSAGHIFGAKLKDNMAELASEPIIIADLPPVDKGLKEGPYLFERNGIYYMTYPHVENKTERLEYAIGNHPLGPFKFTGVIMDESPTECWTNHHSIIEFKDQWYLFYHHNDYSPNFDKNRSIRVDSLFFDDDGTIQKVIPTLRGVGLTDALGKIQIDRYSKKSDEGATIAFLDTLDTFKGWETILHGDKAWVRYNSVDFGNTGVKSIKLKTLSDTGGIVEIRLKSVEGPVVSEVKIPAGKEWKTITLSLIYEITGVQDIIVSLKDDVRVEIDWLSFE